ncbi:glycosyltransferase, partial [Lacticaseibacillus paracasei subsp. paracasei CNCM I-4649]
MFGKLTLTHDKEFKKVEKLKVLVMVPYLNGTGGTETVIKNLNSAYMQSDQKSRYELKLIFFWVVTKKIKWLEDWDKTVYSFSNSRFLQMIMYVIAMPMMCLKQSLPK